MKTPVSLFCVGLFLLLALPGLATDSASGMKIVVLGDSLTAGYGLIPEQAFPARLQAALDQIGLPAQVINSGITGDTSAGGLARLDWALSDQPDLLVIELGANDALRGLDPQQTQQNLASILKRLQEVRIQALLTGMQAPRNLGKEYYSKFDQIYPQLATEFQVPFYPFFLEGVAGETELNQADGIHPTAAGVEVIVAGILPLVEKTLTELRNKKARP